MNKIDIDKFVLGLSKLGLISFGKKLPFLDAINKALNEQGLKIENNEIVEAEQKFKIEASKWYLCVKDYNEKFTVGYLYQADTDYSIDGVDMRHDFPEYIFRPATTEEIMRHNKLADFETTLMMILKIANEDSTFLDKGIEGWNFTHSRDTLLKAAKDEIINKFTQKEIDNMVHWFKYDADKFNDKLVSDIYRQGIEDTIKKILV